ETIQRGGAAAYGTRARGLRWIELGRDDELAATQQLRERAQRVDLSSFPLSGTELAPCGSPRLPRLRRAVPSASLDELADEISTYTRSPMTARLVDDTLRAFTDDLASERPVPGGGSAAAYAGALGAALAAMVARIALKKST